MSEGLAISFGIVTGIQITYWILNLVLFGDGDISKKTFHERLWPGYFIYHMFLGLGKML